MKKLKNQSTVITICTKNEVEVNFHIHGRSYSVSTLYYYTALFLCQQMKIGPEP